LTIHFACHKLFEAFVAAVRVRGEMDRATFQVMAKTGRDWDYVRRSVDPAMSDQNVRILEVVEELKRCECPIYSKEAKR